MDIKNNSKKCVKRISKKSSIKRSIKKISNQHSKKSNKRSVKKLHSKKSLKPSTQLVGGANKIGKFLNIDQKRNVMKKSKDEDKKCAPNKKYEEGSCFTLESLKDMSNAFNTYIDKGLIKNKNKINIVDSKKQLLQQLNDRLKDVCSDQLCWIKQNFVKAANNKKTILEFTFRPNGPQGRFKWLNTTNIDQIMKQYEELFKDFKFLGAVPIDFDEIPEYGIHDLDFDTLYNKGIRRFGIVFNTDESYKSGEHWIAMFFDIGKFEIYFSDSYGNRPEKRIRNFVERIAKWCIKKHASNNNIEPDDSFMHETKKNNIEKLPITKILYNKKRKQFKNSECGIYCVYTIIKLLRGTPVEEIFDNALPDLVVNECRQDYFTFVDPDPKLMIPQEDDDDYIDD